jgi:hypothetical protein
MRSQCCPSIVHDHARVCTYRSFMHGRGRTERAVRQLPRVTSERTNAMTNHIHHGMTPLLALQPERR